MNLRPVYYVLTKAKDRPPGSIATAAIVRCLGCGYAVDSMGGPKDALCQACVAGLRDGSLLVVDAL